MEPSISTQKKIQAVKNYKRAKFAYNLALYSLTSIITCLFFSSSFWFPSITHHFFFSSLPAAIISFCLNAKCAFVLGNAIVIFLVGDSKLKQPPPSSTLDIYDEYAARSRSSSHHKEVIDGSVKTLKIVEEKINHHEENKKEIKLKSMSHGEQKTKGIRSCESEVWGEGAVLIKTGKGKGKREERCSKSKTSDHNEEREMGMRSSRSAVWGESGKGEEEKMKMGMRSCRSEIWSESEIVRMGKTHVGREQEQQQQQQLCVLNKRVEDFIARVNKQRLLEAN